MMSIMEKLIGQVLIPEEYIIILTILPLVVISALLAYYYIHSTLQFAPHKRSYINLKSDSSLAILKYIESIDLLD